MPALGIAAHLHGFRSSFRDWAAECADAPREVMEAALGHVVANVAEAAHARSDLFERRRTLMQQRSDFPSEAPVRHAAATEQDMPTRHNAGDITIVHHARPPRSVWLRRETPTTRQ